MSDDKYKLACIAYAAAQREVKSIRIAISDHLDACRKKGIADWLLANPGRNEWDAPQWQKSPHLADAYAMEADPYNHGGHYYTNHDEDVEGYLEEVCVHCLAAHRAIQQRKMAIRLFGIAKRRISVLGAAAK